MPSVADVAKYILEKGTSVTTWKLQKLVYYCQAWSLVWDEAPLFDEPIEAWANGPVCPKLYEQHRGRFELHADDINGNSALLDAKQRDTVESVLKYYGDKSGQWLSELAHSEDPWKNAREGIPEGDRSNKIITSDSMYEYYGSL